MQEYNSYFRKEIDEMSGYTPGEQPKIKNLIKLNTNENPYPPSPKVMEVIKNFDAENLRRYPDPLADNFCKIAAEKFGVSRDMVIAANGSDDILTMVFRAFTSSDLSLACLEPTYSLYPVLAKIQGAKVIKIKLDEKDFSLPKTVLDEAKNANLLIITRPNAPTGNTFDYQDIEQICLSFKGVVLIDEAYVDFSEDSCMTLAKTLSNVIVSRTLSKSYSLAGIRFGYAIGHQRLIEGLYKLKDSYNVDMLTQKIAEAAFQDEGYLQKVCKKIRDTREWTVKELENLGFEVIKPAGNFVFAAPPDNDGEKYFNFLRSEAIIVRYFSGKITGKYVRITIGTSQEMETLVEKTTQYLDK